MKILIKKHNTHMRNFSQKEYGLKEKTNITQDKLNKLNNIIGKFISNIAVQQQIASDFNNKEYRKFDPSFGDDGCQTRPLILLPIFNSGLKYEELNQREQRYLSLCHILTKYRIIKRDIFDLEFTEVTKPSNIFYEKTNSRVKLQLHEETALIMAEELASMTIDMIREKASIYDEELKFELNQNRRTKGETSLAQEATTPETVLLLQECLRNSNPLLFKIKRIEYLQNSEEFMYQGGDVLMFLKDEENNTLKVASDEERRQYNDTASLCIEAFSIKGVGDNNNFNGLLRALNNKKTFREFEEEIIKNDISHIILLLSSLDDFRKQKQPQTSKFIKLMNEAKELLLEDSLTMLNYASKVNKYSKYFERNCDSVPLNIAHAYTSNLSIEMASIINITPKIITSNICLTPDDNNIAHRISQKTQQEIKL